MQATLASRSRLPCRATCGTARRTRKPVSIRCLLDNDKRQARASGLATECAEFQAKFCVSKKELEDMAQKASQAFYNAIVKAEPGTPPYDDWVKKYTVASEFKIGSIEHPEWGIKIAEGLSTMVVGAKVVEPLKGVYNTLTRSSAAAEDVAAALAEGGEAAGEAAAEIAEEGSALIAEGAEMETVEVTTTLVGRVVAGVGGAIAAGVLFVAVDLVTQLIEDAIKRDKLREYIKQAYPMRARYKLLDLQYEQLMRALGSAIDAYEAELELDDPDFPLTKARLDKLAQRLCDKHITSVQLITMDTAKDELAKLDASQGAWTDDDPK